MFRIGLSKKEIILLEAKKELARRDFFSYCNTMAKDFYRRDRKYLVELCNELQDFYESKDDVLIVNLPPRHGKSRTASLFAEWVFGKNKKEKIMTGSYNETLSTTFSKSVRNAIMTEKASPDTIVYSDIFPDTRIKRGDGAMSLWGLEGGYNNYLATSPTGTATGFGCFPKGTKILTSKGPIDIEDLYHDKSSVQVLSYNHKTDTIRYNDIVSKRRLLSNENIRITTNKGRTIEATQDHKFYTRERGYVRADEILLGETFITASNRARVREMWEKIYKKKIRSHENSKTRILAHLLLKTMFLQGKFRSSEKREMCNMWEDNKRKIKILFREMQEQKKLKNIKEDNMPYMQDRIPTTFTQNKILFNELQEQSSFDKNDRRRKFSLQRRNQLHKTISRNEKDYPGKRFAQMQNMWSRRETSPEQEIWDNNKFKNTSYRRRYIKQFFGKLDYIMSSLSYKITQDEKVINMEFKNNETYVYDIQVARDSNFFADNVLVHNCTLMLIDDLVKNAEEAHNEVILEKHWSWFTNTMLSRLEENGKIIIIMTRWASGDLAGRAIEHFSKENKKVRKIIMKALQDDGTMLCESVLSKESYEMKVRAMGEDIAKANYQQEPIDLKGRLYTEFKTYDKLPPYFEIIKAYCDTADQGSDYLCNFVYGIYNNQAYILDVLYTKEGMEVTEEQMAKMLLDNKVNLAKIESNNGGRGFARSVKRILNDKYNSNYTTIKWFFQSKNKKARILTNATWIMENVFFPANWKDRWSQLYTDLYKYQREGKNAHDDAPDALTGVSENSQSSSGMQVFK